MDLINTSNFSAHVDDLLQRHHVPGLAIATVKNGSITSAGYGCSSLNPPTECTADTLFDIASASKSLTSASVGLLVQDENQPRVRYEATMSSLLPDDFVMSTKEHTDSVTVEDILSHRTGLPSHDNSYMGVKAEHPDTAKSVTRNLRNLPIAAPVRSKYMYCNMMYTVATHLVEEFTGVAFADFLEERFFQPLGMPSTNLQPGRARERGFGERIAPGYSWDEEFEEYSEFRSPHSPEDQGAGSIVTSVNDYIKYVKAIMNQEAPFTQDIYDGLIKSRAFQDPSYKSLRPHTSPTLYAAGWETRWYRGHMVVIHDGLIPGFGSTHFFLPAYKFGGVIFGNADGAGIIASILTQELIDEVIGVPADQREDWNEIETKFGEEEDEDEDVGKLREQLCPGLKGSEPLDTRLGAYTGVYSNVGYHNMTVGVKDEKLFIDATDRSMGFTLNFEHVCHQTKFIAHLSDALEGGDIPFKAVFGLDNGNAVRMGLHLEPDLDDYIWFDRIDV